MTMHSLAERLHAHATPAPARLRPTVREPSAPGQHFDALGQQALLRQRLAEPQSRAPLAKRDTRMLLPPPHIAERLGGLARSTIECLGKSDALYHNHEHTSQGPSSSRAFRCPLVATSALRTSRRLVQAADLVGQLGNPLYPRKVNALYW